MTDAVETEEYVEPDYKAALTKEATSLQARFAEWLQSDEVGYNPMAAKSKKEAFEEGVRLGVALRIPYQASEHNREATAIEREERAAARAAAAAAREAQKAERAAAAQAEAPAETTAPAPKPAKSAAAARKAAKGAPAATPATAPATARPAARRAPARRAATPAATAGDAPF